MRLNIPVSDDAEGLMYDLRRARNEGLYEELNLVRYDEGIDDQVEVTITPELMELLVDRFDLGVNVPPGDKQQVTFNLVYHYDYGRVDELRPTPAP